MTTSTTMEATQAVVTSQQAERRSRWGVFRIFARRSDGTGPHFLPDAQNANISGGAFTQVVGPTIIQQYNIGGSVPNTQTSSAPINSPRDTAEPTDGANGERLRSTNVTVPANQTPPSRRPQDTYQDLLEREGYGFPFWVPSPSRNLQAEYRYEGVSIGDVGVFVSNGAFDYFFNICLPADDPRNARRLPPNFQPLYPPLASLDVMEFDEFSPGNYVASSEIRVSDKDVPLTSRFRSSTTFVNDGPEGAVVVMPHGASEKVLVNDSRFKTYLTAERITSFYQFANDVYNGLGRGIGNGQLRVVYGCTKGTAFSMASIPLSSSSEQPTCLQFNVLDERNRAAESTSITTGALSTSQDQFSWSVSGRARVKVGPGAKDQQGLDPSRVATGLENQCLFVRALDLQLSREIWDRQQQSVSSTVLSKEVHQGETYEVSETAASPGSLSLGSASNSACLGSDTASSGSKNTNNEVIQLELCPHPSAILKQSTFEEYPHAKAVILSDRDWLYPKYLNENLLSLAKMEIHMTKKMLGLVDHESQDGVISFKPSAKNVEYLSHILSFTEPFNTMDDVKTYLFGDAGGNRRNAVAHIVGRVLSQYNQTFWPSTTGRSRRSEHSAPFTSELYAHPWTVVSLLEALEANKNKNLTYLSLDITNLKNSCLLPTGESNLIIISILAHRLQERFRQSGQVEDLHQAIFYYRHIIDEHDTAKETFQWAQKGSDGNFSTSFWIYPTVLIGLSAALYIRLRTQKRRFDYQLLLDCLEKQKQLDLLFSSAEKSATRGGPVGSSQGITDYSGPSKSIAFQHSIPQMSRPELDLHSNLGNELATPFNSSMSPSISQKYKMGHNPAFPPLGQTYSPNNSKSYTKPRKRDVMKHMYNKAASKLGFPSHAQEEHSNPFDAWTAGASSSMPTMPIVSQEHKRGYHPPSRHPHLERDDPHDRITFLAPYPSPSPPPYPSPSLPLSSRASGTTQDHAERPAEQRF